MSQPVFDENISGLPDLELKVDPALMVKADQTTDQKEGDELILPDEPNTPTNPYSMKTSEIFVMRKKQLKEKQRLEKIDERVRIEIDEPEIIDDGISKEVEHDDLQFKMDEEIPKTKRGKRGNDKKPRKKRVMTEKQKENLRKAREKSLAVRRAKKAEKLAKKNGGKSQVLKQEKKEVETMAKPVPIPSVANQAPMSFDYFCDLMDRYEERTKKKHSTTQEPHPNKKIPHQAKPRPPVQKVQRNIVNVRQPPPDNFDPYSILQNNRTGAGSLFGSAFGY